jgi:hypothetical protein
LKENRFKNFETGYSPFGREKNCFDVGTKITKNKIKFSECISQILYEFLTEKQALWNNLQI